MTVTHATFLAAGAAERVQLVETLIGDSLKTLRPGQPVSFDGTTRLSELAIDSIQLVEIKFALDQLVGVDLDVSVFVTDPTVHELAKTVAAAAG